MEKCSPEPAGVTFIVNAVFVPRKEGWRIQNHVVLVVYRPFAAELLPLLLAQNTTQRSMFPIPRQPTVDSLGGSGRLDAKSLVEAGSQCFADGDLEQAYEVSCWGVCLVFPRLVFMGHPQTVRFDDTPRITEHCADLATARSVEDERNPR